MMALLVANTGRGTKARDKIETKNRTITKDTLFRFKFFG